MLSKFSVKKPFTVIVAIIIIAILGVVSYTSTSVDLLPEMNLPYIVVATVYPGAPPEVVEKEVTQAVENGLSAIPNIKSLSSTSSEHVSMVILEFKSDVNVDDAFADVNAAMKMVAFPKSDMLQDPMIIKINPSLLPIMQLSVGKKGTSIKNSSAYLKQIIEKLSTIDGIASVRSSGLITDLAFVNLNSDKMSNALADYFIEATNMQIVLPDETKENMRTALKNAIQEQRESTKRDVEYIAIDRLSFQFTRDIRLNYLPTDVSRQKIEDLNKGLKNNSSGEYEKMLGFLKLAIADPTIIDAKDGDLGVGVELEEAEQKYLRSYIKESLKYYKVSQEEMILDFFIANLMEVELERNDQLLTQIINELIKPNSATRNQALNFVKGVLENEFVLDDINKDVFNDFCDQIFKSSVLTMIKEQLSALTTMLQPSLLQQLLYAQDFDMPAGGITEGALDFVVKIGENITSKEDLTNMPVLTVDYGKIVLKRIQEFQTILKIFDLVSADGTAKFTKAQIDDLSEGIYKYIQSQKDGSTKPELPVPPTAADIIVQLIYNLSQEYQDMIVKAFGDMTAPEISNNIIDTVVFLSWFANGNANDSTDDAITLPDDPTDPEGLYTVDFNKLNANLKKMEDQAIIPLNLGSLANIVFLDDSTKLITSLLMRDESGNLVGSSAVNLTIEKEPDKSTADITKAVNAMLKQMQKDDPNFTYEVLADDGWVINFMIKNIINNLAFGGLLAIGVLLLFLKDIKPTLVVGASIIISVVATFVMMYFAGITLNLVSMGGLSLGVGMLVDNSIVVIENIYRLRAQGKSLFESAVQGAKQVSSAVVASTITTIIVFLPIAFIEGLTKQIFSDLALTITFSLIASLITALTLVPMAASTFMKNPAKRESRIMVGIKNSYVKALNFFLNHKVIPILLVTVLFGGSIMLALKMDTELLPSMDSSSIAVTCVIDKLEVDRKFKETSGKYTYEDAIAETVEILKNSTSKFSDIKTVGINFTTGVAVGGMSVGGGDISAIIMLKDEKSRELSSEEVTEDLTDSLIANAKGLFSITTSSNSILDFAGMGGSSLGVKVHGDDIDLMRTESTRLAEILAGVPGVASVDKGIGNANQEYKIVIDKAKANRYGLTVAQIFLQLQTALTEPGIAHTLKLVDNVDNSKIKNDCSIYIYSYDYKADAWLRGYADESKKEKEFNPIYTSVDGYYMLNTGASLYIKEKYTYKESVYDEATDTTTEVEKIGERSVFVPNGGKINLIRNGNDFTYTYLEQKKSEGENGQEIIELVPTGEGKISIRDDAVYYKVKRIEDIDLVLFPIKTEDMLDPNAEANYIPLFKMLSDASFVKDAEGKVVYRTNNNVLDETLIPSKIATQDGFLTIDHIDRKKVVTITVNFNDEVNQKEVIAAINKAIETQYNIDKPETIFIDSSTGNEMMTETFNTLYIVLALAIVLIYLVMVAQFQSIKSPFIIMFTIPLAFTGSIVALFMFSPTISIMAMIGLIILMGVVVNNGIVFVDYVNQLIQQGVPKRMALLRTGLDRLRPILMTALTTICALFIMALDNSSGGKMLQPMAITTIGGLIYSTVLTLFFVPIIYDLFNRKTKQNERSRAFLEGDIDKIDMENIFDIIDADTTKMLSSYISEDERKRLNELSIAAKELTAVANTTEFEKEVVIVDAQEAQKAIIAEHKLRKYNSAKYDENVRRPHSKRS